MTPNKYFVFLSFCFSCLHLCFFFLFCAAQYTSSSSGEVQLVWSVGRYHFAYWRFQHQRLTPKLGSDLVHFILQLLTSFAYALFPTRPFSNNSWQIPDTIIIIEIDEQKSNFFWLRALNLSRLFQMKQSNPLKSWM